MLSGSFHQDVFLLEQIHVPLMLNTTPFVASLGYLFFFLLSWCISVCTVPLNQHPTRVDVEGKRAGWSPDSHVELTLLICSPSINGSTLFVCFVFESISFEIAQSPESV